MSKPPAPAGWRRLDAGTAAHADLVVADDGVVWPRERVEALRERAWAKIQADQARLEQITTGGSFGEPPA